MQNKAVRRNAAIILLKSTQYFIWIYLISQMLDPAKGRLLISEPFLPDPNFFRSVVLLTEHNQDGSVGLVLNQETEMRVNELFDDVLCRNIVYSGGPVGKNSLLFLHSNESLLHAEPVLPGLYWGGDFEMLKFQLNEGLMNANDVVFFAGYSGWGPGQLQGELEQKSWIVAPARADYIFAQSKDLWKKVLTDMGTGYRHLGNAPEDVQMN